MLQKNEKNCAFVGALFSRTCLNPPLCHSTATMKTVFVSMKNKEAGMCTALCHDRRLSCI